MRLVSLEKVREWRKHLENRGKTEELSDSDCFLLAHLRREEMILDILEICVDQFAGSTEDFEKTVKNLEIRFLPKGEYDEMLRIRNAYRVIETLVDRTRE